MLSVAALAAGLIALRLYLPSLLLWLLNRRLARLDGYSGSVDEIHIQARRLAFLLQGIEVTARGASAPLLTIKNLVVGLEGAPLLRGRLVGSVTVEEPVLMLVKDGLVSASACSRGEWSRAFRPAVPLEIDRIEINNGRIRLIDVEPAARVDLSISRVEATVSNLLRREASPDGLPARLKASAVCFGSGSLTIDLRLDPERPAPTFVLKQELAGVDLPAINDMLFAYAKLRVKRGSFSLSTEVAAIDGRFRGYCKPTVRGLELEHADISLLKRIWSGLVAVTSAVLTNAQRSQLAFRIPIGGTFSEPNVDVWFAIGSLLRNAFVRALLPALDRNIRMENADLDPTKAPERAPAR
ncbi:MAG: DUF748 domain-containing protein [Elusimicrobia bacterium]|nr:DUF748 domain-containing protein [Elusimicrobiota bacterium]